MRVIIEKVHEQDTNSDYLWRYYSINLIDGKDVQFSDIKYLYNLLSEYIQKEDNSDVAYNDEVRERSVVLNIRKVCEQDAASNKPNSYYSITIDGYSRMKFDNLKRLRDMLKEYIIQEEGGSHGN